MTRSAILLNDKVVIWNDRTNENNKKLKETSNKLKEDAVEDKLLLKRKKPRMNWSMN
jgi:hypothetical protein